MLTMIGGRRQVRVSDPRVGRVVSNVDELFQTLHLTVVCLHCGETPRMGNHQNDPQWKLDCGCTERTVANPSPIVTPH